MDKIVEDEADELLAAQPVAEFGLWPWPPRTLLNDGVTERAQASRPESLEFKLCLLLLARSVTWASSVHPKLLSPGEKWGYTVVRTRYNNM